MMIKSTMLSYKEADYVAKNASAHNVELKEFTKNERFVVVKLVGHESDVNALLK